MAEPVRIFCFCWNTQSVRLCESLNQEIIDEHRTGMMTTWRYTCEIMDFWPTIAERITQENPTLVVLSFQEDVFPGSYAHSHLFLEEMPKIGYTLFDRQKLMGVGKTTFTGLMRADPFERGLRMSVYARNDIQDQLLIKFAPQYFYKSIFRNKGAIAIYVTFNNGETLAVINTHLPFRASSLKESVDKNDLMIRQDALNEQNIFFNELYRSLVKESSANPKYVLVMGDLNYRLTPYQNWSATQTGGNLLAQTPESITQIVEQYDEFKQQITKGNIYPLLEGVDNRGPTFAPTCKMKKDRDPGNTQLSAYSLGKQDQRVPSFCDRIIHETRTQEGGQLNCLTYERFDEGVMDMSDHAAVMGTYTID